MADSTEAPSSSNYVEQDVVYDAMHNPNRKSQLFFGLCDMRTATVALNIINVIFTVIVALILITMYAVDNGPYRINAVGSVIGWALLVSAISGLGLYSAMDWKLNGMYAATAAFGIILIVRICQFDFPDVVVTGFLLYPHVIFTMEMRSGIMTPETFDDEEFVTEGGRDFVEMANFYITPTPREAAHDAAQPGTGFSQNDANL
jgi:hypothetical protein